MSVDAEMFMTEKKMIRQYKTLLKTATTTTTTENQNETNCARNITKFYK